jgi:hypothetical protein
MLIDAAFTRISSVPVGHAHRRFIDLGIINEILTALKRIQALELLTCSGEALAYSRLLEVEHFCNLNR